MTAPTINIIRTSRTLIGKHEDVDEAVVTFTASQNIVAWEARAGGSFVGSGLLVGASSDTGSLFPSDSLFPSASLYPNAATVVTAGTEIVFSIENEELQQDGNYRINIYAMNEAGEWTPYGG